MQDTNSKQQIVDRIKGVSNILVTVSTNPSADELSAALGLTLMLNKIDKHTTAVFSGAVPPAITFLKPDKTFENNVDSLRDFIIALDKDKADRLRYKVEDGVVRIFITPYKTKLSEEDFQFSHGDFNVELVIALGVEKREDLDKAITAHGKILHDATIVTVNANSTKSQLGSIDWQDVEASSLCEMLMSLSEALQANILDEQIATALLTGIVSATERFRNNHTSPRVMTMAAQLMAAGANQQLIATRLEEANDIPPSKPANEPDASTKLEEGKSENLRSSEVKKTADGEMHVNHQGASITQDADDAASQKDETVKKTASDESEALATALAEKNGVNEETSAPAMPEDLKKDLEAAAQDGKQPKPEDGDSQQPKRQKISSVKSLPSWRDESSTKPSLGGTLNATTHEAETEKEKDADADSNKVLLDHGGSRPGALNANQPDYAEDDEPKFIDPMEGQTPATSPEPSQPEKEDSDNKPSGPTLADLEAQVQAHAGDKNQSGGAEDARKAVENVINDMPFESAHHPDAAMGAKDMPLPGRSSDLPLPPPPPLPDFSQLPPPPELTPQKPNQAPSQAQTPSDNSPTPSPPPVADRSDPQQFRIPGQ